MSTKEKKKEQILIIGSTQHKDCHCVMWDQKEFPSAVDYHMIIIDCTTLPSTNMTDFFVQNIDKLKDDLFDFLLAGHDIFVIAQKKKIRVKSYLFGQEKEATVDWYAWSPLPIILSDRSGIHIEEVKKFERYFEFLEGWPFEIIHPSHEQLECLYNKFNLDIVNPFFKFLPFAINPAKKAVAASESFELKSKIDLNIVSQISGKLFILPPTTKINTNKAIDLLLKEVIGKYEDLPPPQWLENIKFPIIDIIEKRKNVNKKINSLNKERSKLDKEIEKFLKFKKLLYASGDSLEDIVETALKFIGISIVKPKYSKADSCIIYDKVAYIIETKGKKGLININDLRQLSSYLDEWMYEKKQSEPDCRGILIGNPLRTLNPKKRKEELFTKDAIDHAKRRKIALISTNFLFNLVKLKMQDKKIDIEKLIKDIFSEDKVLINNPKNYS